MCTRSAHMWCVEKTRCSEAINVQHTHIRTSRGEPITHARPPFKGRPFMNDWPIIHSFAFEQHTRKKIPGLGSDGNAIQALAQNWNEYASKDDVELKWLHGDGQYVLWWRDKSNSPNVHSVRQFDWKRQMTCWSTHSSVQPLAQVVGFKTHHRSNTTAKPAYSGCIRHNQQQYTFIIYMFIPQLYDLDAHRIRICTSIRHIFSK